MKITMEIKDSHLPIEHQNGLDLLSLQQGYIETLLREMLHHLLDIRMKLEVSRPASYKIETEFADRDIKIAEELLASLKFST